MRTVTALHYGAQTLAGIHRMLELDEAFTLRHDDGFSWWPHHVPVRFRWRAPGQDDPLGAWRLSAEVDAVHGIDLTDGRLPLLMLPAARILNQFSSVIEEGALRFRTLVVLLPEGAPNAVAQLLYRAAFMVAMAERLSPRLAAALAKGPRPASSDHPTAGPRPTPAPQLSDVLDEVLHAGAAPTPEERRPDLGAAMVALRQSGCGMVAGPRDLNAVDAFNVVIETRHSTSLLELRLNERNPNVGYGLLAVLRLRFPPGHLHGDGASLVRELAAAEWATPAPLHVHGSWTAGVDGADVAYSAFHPNVLHHGDLGREVALDGLRRVRWAFDRLGYTEPFSTDGPYVHRLLGRPEAAGVEA